MYSHSMAREMIAIFMLFMVTGHTKSEISSTLNKICMIYVAKISNLKEDALVPLMQKNIAEEEARHCRRRCKPESRRWPMRTKTHCQMFDVFNSL